ncbi:unnamed protein product [Victoria cruziana]
MAPIPHALVIPFGGQGHVGVLMELSHRLADNGILLTFVYGEHLYRKVMAGLPENFCSDYVGRIRLVTMPDGLPTDEDLQDFDKVFSVTQDPRTPSFVEHLILKTNENDEHKITFVIADGAMGFLLDVAKKLNLPRAALWPSSWSLATVLNIEILINDGVIDQNVFQTGDSMVQLSQGIPAFMSAHLFWLPFGDTRQQGIFFRHLRKCAESMKGLTHILCNTFEELESPFLGLIENAIPIGPLLPANKFKRQPSSIWAEDLHCMDWLDRQPTSSVIYVSLGSTTVFNQCQLGEFALGLELTGRRFLLVCRPFASRALIVKWAPQKEVLSHPSVACFLTHCGWNSTIEAVSNGVPMLCRPYFTDQFLCRTIIVEVWKVGLQLVNDGDKVVGKEEIKEKLKLILNDKEIRETATDLKEKAVKAVMTTGSSAKNFEGFVHIIKNMNSFE